MQQLILVLHVLVAVTIIVLIMLQQGKGAQMGAAFGSGASQTLFGSRGATSFLVKITAGLVAVFFVTSLILGYLSGQQTREDPLAALTNAAVKVPTPAPTKSAPAPIAPNAGVPIPAGELPANKK